MQVLETEEMELSMAYGMYCASFVDADIRVQRQQRGRDHLNIYSLIAGP
jgi:hypothetical protein